MKTSKIDLEYLIRSNNLDNILGIPCKAYYLQLLTDCKVCKCNILKMVQYKNIVVDKTLSYFKSYFTCLRCNSTLTFPMFLYDEVKLETVEFLFV